MPNAQYPFAPPPEPGDKAAPRRRRHRRGRRGGSGAPQAPAVQNDRQAGQAQQQAEKHPPTGKNQQAGGARKAPAPAQNGAKAARGQDRPAPARQRPAQEQGRRGAQPQGERRSGTPGHTRAPQSSAAGRAPAAAQDPGLLLISRRPPKQKFSNFEEYIAAHGGVTAPLPGEETPPDTAPQER